VLNDGLTMATGAVPIVRRPSQSQEAPTGDESTPSRRFIARRLVAAAGTCRFGPPPAAAQRRSGPPPFAPEAGWTPSMLATPDPSTCSMTATAGRPSNPDQRRVDHHYIPRVMKPTLRCPRSPTANRPSPSWRSRRSPWSPATMFSRLGDRKVAHVSLEARGWAGIPVSLDLRLQADYDSSGAAGVTIDQIRLAASARRSSRLREGCGTLSRVPRERARDCRSGVVSAAPRCSADG
jgi:hypothetical protein